MTEEPTVEVISGSVEKGRRMVVVHTRLPNGKLKSETRHQRPQKDGE